MGRSLFFLLLLLAGGALQAQIGVGAAGSLAWPGVQASSPSSIRFKPGAGYRFFFRHDVSGLYGGRLHLKYAAGKSVHRVDLPQAGETVYKFSDFTIDLLWETKPTDGDMRWYVGAGGGLLALVSDNRYRANYSDEFFIPQLTAGTRWNWYEGFDAYAEVVLRYGETGAGPEPLPVTSVRLTIGFTMFISEEEP